MADKKNGKATIGRKAPNYGARAGQNIIGKLFRNARGQFEGNKKTLITSLGPKTSIAPSGKVSIGNRSNASGGLGSFNLTGEQSFKAANYSAHAGQVIAGNLARGNDGKFTSAGNAKAEDKPEAGSPEDIAQIQARLNAPKGGKGKGGKGKAGAKGGKGAKPKKTDAEKQAEKDKKKQELEAKKKQNLAQAMSEVYGDDFAELFTVGDDPQDLSGVKPEYGDQLVKKGLATQDPDTGEYVISPAGKAVVRAMQSGDVNATNRTVKAAQRYADRQQAKAKRAADNAQKKVEAAQAKADAAKKKIKAVSFKAVNRAKVRKVMHEFKTGTLKSSSGKPVTDRKQAIAIALSEAGMGKKEFDLSLETGNPVIFKDISGAWRWVTFSSSAFEDRDGEVIALKALEEDCDRADREGHGPVYWWHLPELKIGECDFNAMHGRILIESGTFNNERIAQAVLKSSDILGVSVGYTFEKPDYSEDKIFYKIKRFERSFLPSWIASNQLTKLYVYPVKGEERMKGIKFDAFRALLGNGPEAEEEVKKILGQAETLETGAAEKGLRSKEVAQKAEGDPEAGEDPSEEAAEDETMVMDMTASDLETLIIDAVQGVLQGAMAGNAETATKELSAIETVIKEFGGIVAGAIQELTQAYNSRLEGIETRLKELGATAPKRATNAASNVETAQKLLEQVNQDNAKRKEANPETDVLGFMFGDILNK